MKTKTLLATTTLLLLLFSANIKAQDVAFDKGTVVATAGFGFPDLYRGTLRVAYNGYTSTKVTGFGPIILKGDYGIVKFKWGHSVGGGIVLGYNATKVDFSYTDFRWNNGNNSGYYTYNQTDKYNTLTIGARGSYHFFTKEKFDCYASVGLGLNINSHTQITNDPTGYRSVSAGRSGIYSAFTVGIRYFFTKNIGVYSELGWDMSAPIQAGIALKF